MCYYGKAIGKNLKTMVSDIEPLSCKLACIAAYPFSAVIKKLRYDKFVN